MFILEAEHSFDSAHFLTKYSGKCANIHGHRWRVIVKVYEENLHKDGELKGMVNDFGNIKKDMQMVINEYDHALIIEKNSLNPLTFKVLREEGFKIIETSFRTTAEEFSRYFYNIFINMGHKVKSVTVFETPTNSATYERL